MNWLTFAAMVGVGIVLSTSVIELGQFIARRPSAARHIGLAILAAALCALGLWLSTRPTDVVLGFIAGGTIGPIARSGSKTFRHRRRSA